jgi:ComF family protein
VGNIFSTSKNLCESVLKILNTKLPSQCAVCRQWGTNRICSACVERFATPTTRCHLCALSVPAGVERCGQCVIKPPPFERCLAAVDYAFPWSQLILQLKFHGALELISPLSTLLAQTQAAQHTPAPDFLLPVPLHLERLQARGFNQAWEITRQLGKRLHIQTRCHGLARTKNTHPQLQHTALERVTNVSGAFVLNKALQVNLLGAHVAIVDDVMTTGATATELSRILKLGGAASVQVWVVARTPMAPHH